MVGIIFGVFGIFLTLVLWIGYVIALGAWWLAFLLGPLVLIVYFLHIYRAKKSYYFLLVLPLLLSLIFDPGQVYFVLIIASLILAYAWLWKHWKHPFILVLATLIVLPVLAYKVDLMVSIAKNIPPQIGLAYPVESGSALIGFREGCHVGIFKISHSTQEAIEKEGLSFFDGALRGRGHQENDPTYQKWDYEKRYFDVGERSIFDCTRVFMMKENEIREASDQGVYHTYQNFDHSSRYVRLYVIPSSGYVIYGYSD